MNLRSAISVLGAILMIVLAGCGSSSGTTKRDNLAYLYGRGSATMQLQTRVYHASKETSTLYFKLNTRDLLYKSDGSGGPYMAVVQLRYEAFAEWNMRSLLDSASILVQDQTTNTSEDKELIGSMPLRAVDRDSYVLRISAVDLNRDNKTTAMLRVERDEKGTRQYFLPVDPRNGLPFFTDNLQPGQRVKVLCEAFAGRTLHGTHHANDPALPAPVFTTSGSGRPLPATDSSFTVVVDGTEGSFELTMESPGIHFLRPDTSHPNGIAFFVLKDSHPYVGTGADMLKPLRYITSLQEYDRITRSANVRQAIERFWLDAAGDRERARDAIRIYYNRVENANRHFTSHVEGWRTDRGLVHIIFGTPNTIYKSDMGETWVFGEENNLMSLTFNFVKRMGPFTDNDLVLERDPLLKGAWYRNVESWRNGRVQQN
jgi:GWxTD domain-containing protein